MARKYEEIMEHVKEFMNDYEEFMVETVKTRIYVGNVCTAIRTLQSRIMEKNEYEDMSDTLLPLKDQAPETENYGEIIDYIGERIDQICESEDVCKTVEFVEKAGCIYRSLMGIENMFNPDKLSEIPEWQADLP